MDIQRLIDNELGLQRSKPHSSSGKWKPSSFGYCFRRQYWQRSGQVPSDPIDPITLRKFKAGDLFHDFVQTLVVKADPSIKTEVLVEYQGDVKGYADIVNHTVVYDIKSIHTGAFGYMNKSENIVKDKYNNWLQVMFYCIALNKKKGALVFVSKDDLRIKELYQDNNAYWQQEVENELKELRSWWDSQELPPAKPRCYANKKDFPKKYLGAECEFCDYYTLCTTKEGELTNAI